MASKIIMKRGIKIIDDVHSKTDTQDCYHCSQESQFQPARKPQIRFASGGFAPWTPNGVLPLYPAGGLGGLQTPCLLPPTHFNSPATSNHCDNPRFALFGRV